MEVADVLHVLANGSNDVAIHNLHVVNVVQKFDAGRADSLHYIDTPGRVVAHVIFVIHLAVEQLHADGDVFLFGIVFDVIQKQNTVVCSFGVGHAPTISGKRNDVWALRGGGKVDSLPQGFLETLVIFLAIKGIANRTAVGRGDHGRHEIMLLQDRPVFRANEIEAVDSASGGLGGHLVERHWFAFEDALGDTLF